MRRRHFITTVAGAGLATAGLTAGTATAAPRARTTSAPGQWSQTPAPGGQAEATLNEIVAENVDRAWAVGEQGRSGSAPGRPLALHWDGSGWVTSDTSRLDFVGGIRSVSAGGEDNTWAVGTDADGGGHLLAWDGGGWRPTAYPGQNDPGCTLGAVLAVSGSGQSEAWAVGARAEGEPGLLHWDGVDWRWSAPLPADPAPALHGLTRAPDGAVWVYGTETVARWDGAWTVIPSTHTPRSSISGLLPVANDDVWLVGWSYGVGGPPGKPPSTVLRRYDGTEWVSVDRPYTVGALSGIVANASGAPDRIVGWDFWDQNSAHYLRWDAAQESWLSERGPDSGGPVQQNAITTVPGTSGGHWSAGTSAGQPRIERRG